jgi:WD40 repeat protein
MCLLSIWFGHLNGNMALGGGCDIEWFCIGFLWPWAFFAVVGGIVALASSRKTDSPSRGTARVAVGVLLAAAGLLACGFAQLRFRGEQPVVTFRAAPFFLQAITFSPDAKTIATVGSVWDKNVRLWDAATGRALGQCDKERANNGMEKAAVQCFGNPPVVAASSHLSPLPRSDSKIVIQTWDLATQTPQQRFQWDDRLEVRHSVFSRDGRWFVYSNGNLRAFDLQAGRVVVDLKRRKGSDVCSLAVSPARDRLACATYDRELEIWDLDGARLSQQIRTADKVFCMDFSPDGRSLAYGSISGMIEKIAIGGEKAASELSCFDHNGVDALTFSPNGALLACAGGDEGKTKVIDANRWTVVAVLKTWGAYRIECLAFSSDGRRLATGDANGLVGVWDTTGWLERDCGE